ncbi:uncharacterized protein LOC105286300 isoform X2 [Ooceraea biroi]|uniref:uncharacterized protein LOC105286300 isoform X2 n=1 Tax=Ooceraea biroi TaxID=2015173 RepID=UPI0005B84D8D|nr:uncharacterized protein LOC105286300 isoform X2 [Ooceraea biroi]
MGVIFLEHIGGARLFSCASCDTNLTNRSQLVSTRFTGATGRAFLFNKVVNLNYRWNINKLTSMAKICLSRKLGKRGTRRVSCNFICTSNISNKFPRRRNNNVSDTPRHVSQQC